ncbi:MAG: butyrate kinase [Exilispira sp.]
MAYKMLIINPGSTSTKIGIYEDEKEISSQTLRHSVEELKPYPSIIDQIDFRTKIIEDYLASQNIELKSFSAIVGRGGLLKPIESGTYSINEKMLEDLKSCKYGAHASNLGALIAYKIAKDAGINSFIVDPVVVDELSDEARICGHPLFKRVSIFHALNQKAVARSAAKALGKKYEDVNLIVAHLGGGISIGSHRKGKVVDVNNALDGEGPFSPERAGTLPAGQLIEAAFSGKYNLAEMKKMLTGQGGLTAHLGTNDVREVVKRIDNNDKNAELILNAMCFTIAKYIFAGFASLYGDVDAIVLTGGIAYNNDYIVEPIKKYLGKIIENIPVLVFPGEEELFALAAGALRVLKGEEKAKIYE